MENINNLIPFSTIAQRAQWDANHGYCGETSYIAALMYYGGYMSQYNMRELVLSFINRNNENEPYNQSDEESQLLLDSDMIDTMVASALTLSYEKYDGGTVDDFIRWIEKHTNNLVPVIIGVYNSNVLLDNPNNGLDTYDHIVSALSVNDNLVTIWDNGLNSNTTNDIPIMTREDAYNNDSIYAIPNTEPASLGNWGIAMTGINLPSECIRLQVTSSDASEPEMIEGSIIPPEGIPITLTIHLYDLEPNTVYFLYRFNNVMTLPKNNFNKVPNSNFNNTFNKVPNNNFNKNYLSRIGVLVTTINNPMQNIVTDTINSGDTAIYRCYRNHF
jgi:hypothetical protein